MALIQKNIDRYRIIFELSPEAIIIFDKKGTLLDVNNRLSEWLMYKPEEVVGKNLLKLPFLPKQSVLKVREKFVQRMMGKKIDPYELDFIDKKGNKKVGLVTAVPIKDTKGKIVEDLVMISDVTIRRKNEEDLQKKLTELERINRLMIGRELEMVRLKEKIKKLEAKK